MRSHWICGRLRNPSQRKNLSPRQHDAWSRPHAQRAPEASPLAADLPQGRHAVAVLAVPCWAAGWLSARQALAPAPQASAPATLAADLPPGRHAKVVLATPCCAAVWQPALWRPRGRPAWAPAPGAPQAGDSMSGTSLAVATALFLGTSAAATAWEGQHLSRRT